MIPPKRTNETNAAYNRRVSVARNAMAARRNAASRSNSATIVPVQSKASHAQEHLTPEAPNGEMTLEMELPETMPIVSLIDLVGKHLQLDFMYDEKEVEG
ncbi:MAG: hypothetical protein HQ515_01325, partial [Phycisphaeraceae bacterium]|nr:hypothetical protein [Phycisphaeraceae bacterium]